MTRFRLLAAEALRSIGANKSTTLAAAVTVLVGMFLLGVFIGLGTWLVSWSDAKKKELVVHVFLKEDATNKQINAVEVFLQSDPHVKPGGVHFITKAEALKKMEKEAPELTQNLISNPLPASFDVTPKRGEDTEAIGTAVQQAGLGGVDEVRWGKEVSKRIRVTSTPLAARKPVRLSNRSSAGSSEMPASSASVRKAATASSGVPATARNRSISARVSGGNALEAPSSACSTKRSAISPMERPPTALMPAIDKRSVTRAWAALGLASASAASTPWCSGRPFTGARARRWRSSASVALRLKSLRRRRFHAGASASAAISAENSDTSPVRIAGSAMP